jgi:translocator protein
MIRVERLDFRSLVDLTVFLAGTLLAGWTGSLVTEQAIPTWYQALEKPAWSQAGWIFGPVWLALYLMMGIAAWLIWRQGWDVPRVRIALGVFAAQLLAYLLWTWIFFGWQRTGLALLAIFLLWGLVGISMLRFHSLKPLSGLLVFPYWLWVSFAALLNAAVWWLNRS